MVESLAEDLTKAINSANTFTRAAISLSSKFNDLQENNCNRVVSNDAIKSYLNSRDDDVRDSSRADPIITDIKTSSAQRPKNIASLSNRFSSININTNNIENSTTVLLDQQFCSRELSPIDQHSKRLSSTIATNASRSSIISNLSGLGLLRSDEGSVNNNSDIYCDVIQTDERQPSPQTGNNSTATTQFIRVDSNAISGNFQQKRLSERAKKKSWYNVLYPNYKSRSIEFKKLFKELPNAERLIVDYSCAFQRDILVQGRLYVSQNYVCFHANIFSWETYLNIEWKDVTSITKEKTAHFIPNAISICTVKEKYFFATFATRDRAFLMLFRIWQNTLMKKELLPQEMWQWVHESYGLELGLTSDDEDYIDPNWSGDLKAPSLEEGSSFTSLNENRRSNTNIVGRSTDCGKSVINNSAESGSDISLWSAASNQIVKSKSSAKHKNSDMKANVKELTLTSAKPNESPESGVVVGSITANKADNSKKATSSSSSNAVDSSKRKIAPKSSRNRDDSAGKSAETIPTDMSDSSDSDEMNIPFVATAECTSPHEGRQLVHTILPINIDTLFNMLFSKSKFLVDFHTNLKSTDTNFGEWITNEDGQKLRTVNLTVQLAASVGPKTSKVTEYQVMRECSKPSELYSIDVDNVNAGIPYADSFSVLNHWCMVRTIDDHTMLSVHAQIKYKKSIWGVVKGLIEKSAWTGLENFYGALLHALQSETCIPPAKGKGRRPRRGIAGQNRPQDEILAGTSKAMPNVKVLEPLDKLTAVGASHSVQQSSTKISPPPTVGVRSSKYKWLSLFVIILLLFLIGLNAVLLLKLWRLETHIELELSQRSRFPNLASFKELPNSNEEWLSLVREQELLHEAELKKWHTVLQTAIQLLKKVSVVCQNLYENDDKLIQYIGKLGDHDS